MSKLDEYIKSLAEWDRKPPTDLVSFLDRLRLRYGEPAIPPCRLCGGELSLHASGPTGTTWYCDGYLTDGVGEREYKPGRSRLDHHFSASVHRVYQHGDSDVIALIDAFVEQLVNPRASLPPGKRRSQVARRKSNGRRR